MALVFNTQESGSKLLGAYLSWSSGTTKAGVFVNSPKAGLDSHRVQPQSPRPAGLTAVWGWLSPGWTAPLAR